MADEIAVSVMLRVENGSLSFKKALAGLTFDQSSAKMIHSVQNVGTSEEAVDLGDVATPGWALFINRDDTNYVTIRDGSGGDDVVKLEAGEFALFRLATATPYAIANTAACDVEYVILED